MRWGRTTPTVPARRHPKHPLARQRGRVWVTHFLNQEQLSQNVGGTAPVQVTEGGSQNRSLHASFRKHSYHWAELQSIAQRTLQWNLRAGPQQQQPAPVPVAGALDLSKGISQMLRNSQLTHGPISWLHAGLFTPLVLEKEVKQPVLMCTFNSFEKPPDCRKTEQSCEVWSWFPTQKPGRMLDP